MLALIAATKIYFYDKQHISLVKKEKLRWRVGRVYHYFLLFLLYPNWNGINNIIDALSLIQKETSTKMYNLLIVLCSVYG